ncbi:MAG: HD domain-containing protein [Methanolinea sp.]
MERDALSAIHLAAGIAARAHAGQARKDGITPYIVHPARVATLAARFGGDHVAIVSAWLHDVFEDCAPGACAAARKEIGALPLPEGEARAVMAIVEALTKDPSLPKEVQIPDSLDRILAAPPQAGPLLVQKMRWMLATWPGGAMRRLVVVSPKMTVPLALGAPCQI